MAVRGIELNNPGNIRLSADVWQGASASQPDPSFVNFTAPVWGVRAMSRVLYNYRDLYQLRSIRQLITRWAPPSDNNPTEAYIRQVSSRMGISDTVPLDFSPQTMTSLVKAMMIQEVGTIPYSDAVIRQGVALGSKVGEKSTGRVVVDSTEKDSPAPQAEVRPVLSGTPDAGGIRIISLVTDPVLLGLENSVSTTSSARYCFVNQEFSRNLQIFLLKYSKLVSTYNTEYV